MEQTIDPGKALAAYDPRQYQVVVRPEDLVPLSPLVRIDLTAVPLGECAAIGGGKVMPSREVTDQIGSAAGCTFIESGCSVEKLDATTWVGRATAERMMRDGSRERRVAEYEWDAELRAEETARAKAGPKYESTLLQNRKFGRQRADTGARLRVIRSLTGIPTAFKPDAAKRPIVLARASVNVEVAMADPVMRQALIAQALGAQGDVFGPLRDVTPQPAALPEVPETPLDEETAEAVADEIVDDELGGAGSFTEEEQGAIEDVFGDASGDQDVEIERAWLQKELAKGLGKNGTEAVTQAVNNPKLTAAHARELRESVVAHRKREAAAAQGGQS